MEEQAGPIEQWGVIEIMGHRRVAGRVSEEAGFGTALLRVDIPTVGPDGQEHWRTQSFGGAAIFCISWCDEATARQAAQQLAPREVHQASLPVLRHPRWDDQDIDGDEDEWQMGYGDDGPPDVGPHLGAVIHEPSGDEEQDAVERDRERDALRNLHF